MTVIAGASFGTTIDELDAMNFRRDNFAAQGRAPKRTEPRHRNVVYFIQCGTDGPIRIGRSNGLANRLSAIQNAHHETLHLRAWVHAHDALEPVLHKRSAKQRIRGEWFRPHYPVKDFIRRLLADDVPKWALHYCPQRLPAEVREPAPIMLFPVDRDPAREWCDRCGYAVEGELVERRVYECYRCLASADPDIVTGRRAA